MRTLLFQATLALLLSSATAFGQTVNCAPTVFDVVDTPDTSASVRQTNSNFNALSRSVACLQNALAESRRVLDQAEREIRELRARTTRPADSRPLREAVVRACQSPEAEVIYLPNDVACSRLGPAWQSREAGFPVWRVMVPQ